METDKNQSFYSNYTRRISRFFYKLRLNFEKNYCFKYINPSRMKRFLPYLIFFIAFLSLASLGVNAQNNCPTCHQGMNIVNDTSIHPKKSLAPNKFNPDGNDILGTTPSYSANDVCGLNYVTESVVVETRETSQVGSGIPATITVPGCLGAPIKAYLYWGVSYFTASAPSYSVVVTNPVPSTSTYVPTLIGTGPPKCWSEVGTAAYRADITASVSAGGNYVIHMRGASVSSDDESIDGITLVYIYNSGGAYSGSIALWDGDYIDNSPNGGELSETFSGINVCAASGTASAFAACGDMQNNLLTTNTDDYNGTTATFPNSFWNTNVIATSVTAAQTTTTFDTYTNNSGDCFSWIMAGLYWQNTTCVACVGNPALNVTSSQVNPTCGNDNGSATANASGGIAPYTYLWTPGGQTNATATGLSAGTYTCTVTDAQACSPTETVIVTLTTTSLNVSANVSADDKCSNSNNGTASSTVSGGTAPYTYAWTPIGGSGPTGTGLTAGTYTLTVTDNAGCTGTAVVTITAPPALTANTVMTAAGCGANNGTATVTAGGGTAPYTYSWAPGGQTGITATGLSAGSYTVTVTDNNLCTTTSVITVTSTGAIAVSINAWTNVLCFGGNTGTATATVTGGTAPYTYAWTPIGGSNVAGTGLTAGSYTVTVKDANGCIGTASVNINQPAAALAATMGVPTNVLCFGGNTGSATVAVSGGTGPYTYAWVPNGGTGPTGTGLTAGSYTVNVTDNNGCTTSATVIINQPTALTASTVMTQAQCGNPTGTATVTAGGGTAPYTYSWAPGGQTGITATGLSAGSYTVTVTDNNLCTTTSVIIVTNSAGIVVTMGASTSVLCNGGNTGTATVNVVGGSLPYTYAWTPIGGTGPTGSGLTAGSYTVTVTDNNGCTGTASVIINQPAALVATMGIPTNVSCFGGNNGSATVTVNGGTGPYTYLWVPIGGSGPTGSGLTAGSYTVNITDNNGCPTMATVIIGQPAAIVVNTSTVSANCNQSNGSATAIVNGGTGPYTYAWTPSNQTLVTATGLSASTYTVTVTDNNGCTQTASATVGNLNGETATIGPITQISCFGGANGTITVNVVGGTGPYTYLWTPSNQTLATATGLSANTYVVTVTDANGCTSVATTTLTQPSQLQATMGIPTNVLCNGGNTGSATVTVTGGTGPYTYAWAPLGGTGPTGTGLTAGIYNVTITDNNGCSVVSTVTINQPAALTTNIVGTNPLCSSGTGSATVTVNGGTGPYTYLWTPVGGTGPTANNLSAGSYTVNITDNNGCPTMATIIIVAPAALTINTSTISANCNQNNGSATVIAGGGTGAYTYSWMPGNQTNATATALSAATYTITVTDNNGCSITSTATVTNLNGETATIGIITNVSCFGGANGTITVNVVGGTGPYTYLWTPSNQTNATATGLSAGSYNINVTDANGCISVATAVVTAPTQLIATMGVPVNDLCFGAANGSATVTVSGGTGPYTYSWAPNGGSGPTGTGLSAGTYNVTITDNNGCSVVSSVTISSPALLSANISTTVNVSCSGGSNGSLTVTVTGGVNPYTYAWTPVGGNGATANGLSAGIYTISVTDANGCTASATGTIAQPNALAVTTTSTQTSCGNTGTATATPTGGTAPYLYSWTPSLQTNATATALSAGTYTITVTDNNGCTVTGTATVTSGAAVTATVGAIVNVSCNGGNNGTATVNVANGTLPYTYLWSDATSQTNATATGLTAGDYTVTVHDNNGCSASTSATVGQPTALIVSVSGTQAVCFGQTASLSSSVSGGIPGYGYSWAPAGGNASTASVIPIANTTYTLTVTDANGCTASATTSVAVNAAISVVVSGPSAVCPGGTASMSVSASGGDGTYYYLWSDGATTQNITITPDSSGIYSVKIWDGCGSLPVIVQVPVTVDPLPNVKFETDISAGCSPLCVQFRNLTTIGTSGIHTYTWTFGTSDSSSDINPIYCYKNPGDFSVTLTATSDSGCSSTLRVLNLITAYAHPAASFSYSPNPINIINPQVQFTDKTADIYAVTDWNWTFGDNSDSSSKMQNPVHTYQDTGVFCATLSVMDINGCTDTITDCLDVEPLYTFYIPDAFTPNGDNINDVFMPKGSYMKSYEMYIYDRWGMQLFHSTEITNGWDGSVKGGQIAQEDTYVYVIHVTDASGNDHNYTGKVNLIK
jgi:large repetitive protein